MSGQIFQFPYFFPNFLNKKKISRDNQKKKMEEEKELLKKAKKLTKELKTNSSKDKDLIIFHELNKIAHHIQKLPHISESGQKFIQSVTGSSEKKKGTTLSKPELMVYIMELNKDKKLIDNNNIDVNQFLHSLLFQPNRNHIINDSKINTCKKCWNQIEKELFFSLCEYILTEINKMLERSLDSDIIEYLENSVNYIENFILEDVSYIEKIQHLFKFIINVLNHFLYRSVFQNIQTKNKNPFI